MTLILAIPRTVSSALGRSISQSPDISEYIFQPFYNDDSPVKTVSDYFDETIQRSKPTKENPAHILVKETVDALSLQRFIALYEHAYRVIFLVRDPQSQAFSTLKAAYPQYELKKRDHYSRHRLRKVSHIAPPDFYRTYVSLPWQNMANFLRIANSRESRAANGISKYRIVDGDILRNFPEETLHSITRFLDIEFSKTMLSNWHSTFDTSVNTDNNFSQLWVGKAHRTKSLKPSDQPSPVLDDFARKFITIIKDNLEIYGTLLTDKRVLCPANQSLFSRSSTSTSIFTRYCPITAFAFVLKLTLENSPYANEILEKVKKDNPQHAATFTLIQKVMKSQFRTEPENFTGVHQRFLLNAITGANHGISF